MSQTTRRLQSKWAVLPPVVLALGLLVWMVGGRKAPQKEETHVVGKAIRVLTAAPVTFTPTAAGYGTVEPDKSWQAVAEVGGRLVYLNPDVKAGSLLAEGTVLFRIDPSEYEIALTRNQAQYESIVANLQQLNLEEQNLQANLKLEKKSLALQERNFRRNLSLAGEGSISETLMDQAESELVRGRISVQNLENQLSTIPTQRRQLEAQQKQYAAQVADSERRLTQTEIRMPFDGRINSKKIEEGQAVFAGNVLAEVSNLAAAEIKTGLVMEKLHGLMPHGASNRPIDFTPSPQIFNQLGLSAEVSLEGRIKNTWPARFSRFDASLDPETRMLGVIVTVNEPYRDAKPGVRPPLVKGMLCKVVVKGRPRQGFLVPESALHGNELFLADANNQLKRIRVKRGVTQDGYTEIAAGLSEGDRVVLSDIEVPAVGMLLDPSEDTDNRDRIQQYVAAQGVQP
ncbi:efflux RND transporter periplasmic adaptor subunit [Acanthopleuribacter pedis]|uniref:Multidrug resistance protein MdtA-like barrel-sandwich hybrid domain-containing protein n=1 Tax=Acanthopleuribacter pedis TaxID=442870 RepID=A0A8J7U4P5_9BACT|nr:hypothetical protein [Acanthopleuribacter pedis]MBO1321693.1 hypothetical protein [Acanthopleuribacter pedis]